MIQGPTGSNSLEGIPYEPICQIDVHVFRKYISILKAICSIILSLKPIFNDFSRDIAVATVYLLNDIGRSQAR